MYSLDYKLMEALFSSLLSFFFFFTDTSSVLKPVPAHGSGQCGCVHKHACVCTLTHTIME